ncbi:hypothetical protein Q4560_15705 [Celeribacter halophilus]|uniref:Membrane-bound lysozyme-inhibitor of c-type lysozyme n=1 Tax=Celeribacter halophilus TaxID=576117 RepID=A0AAW7XXX5_9RHOB|nr:hypothetical protein [Celeribacter halophilus]MDO6458967.1 hypothetical protein [Celeribacter halophilus]MDO6724717.1 hypothetical protein [Celeribacter halophilus]
MFERLMKGLSITIAFGCVCSPAMAEDNSAVDYEVLSGELQKLVIYRCVASDRPTYFVFEKEGGELRLMPDYSDEGDVVSYSNDAITITSGTMVWVIGDKSYTEVDDGEVATGFCDDTAKDIVAELAWILEEQQS